MNLVQSTLWPEEFPASPSPLPESRLERKTTVTSGQKCAASLESHSPLGFLSRMLLTSPLWHSMTYALIWKPTTTKRKRLYFRLAPSKRPTGESASFSWPTPDARDSQAEGIECGARRWEKYRTIGLQSAANLWLTPTTSDVNGMRQPDGKRSGGLNTQVWKTPTAGDASGSRALPDGTSETGRRPDGSKAQVGLQTQVRMWPTPRASDGEKGGPNQRDSEGRYGLPGAVNHVWPTPQARDYRSGDPLGTKRQLRKVEQGWSPNLNDVVLWPTPNARDFRSGKGRQDNGHTPQLPEILHGMLNPAWVECLMGFPEGWTDIGQLDPAKPNSSGSRPGSSRSASSTVPNG